MFKEALEYLIDVGRLMSNKPVEVGGNTYWSYTGNSIIPPKPKVCEPVASVLTLDAMLSSLDAPEFDDIDKSRLQIVVESHKYVAIVTAPDPNWAHREFHIAARCDTKPFPFGQFLDIEEFIVNAQCRFVDNGPKRAMITHVSSICDEKIITNTDDGISQSVVREDKVGRKGRHEMTPILNLRPYRTFSEIEQPESPFLLRIKDGPKAALFEADGGLWETKAVTAIAEYIRQDERVNAKEISVIG